MTRSSFDDIDVQTSLQTLNQRLQSIKAFVDDFDLYVRERITVERAYIKGLKGIHTQFPLNSKDLDQESVPSRLIRRIGSLSGQLAKCDSDFVTSVEDEIQSGLIASHLEDQTFEQLSKQHNALNLLGKEVISAKKTLKKSKPTKKKDAQLAFDRARDAWETALFRVFDRVNEFERANLVQLKDFFFRIARAEVSRGQRIHNTSEVFVNEVLELSSQSDRPKTEDLPTYFEASFRHVTPSSERISRTASCDDSAKLPGFSLKSKVGTIFRKNKHKGLDNLSRENSANDTSSIPECCASITIENSDTALNSVKSTGIDSCPDSAAETLPHRSRSLRIPSSKQSSAVDSKSIHDKTQPSIPANKNANSSSCIRSEDINLSSHLRDLVGLPLESPAASEANREILNRQQRPKAEKPESSQRRENEIVTISERDDHIGTASRAETYSPKTDLPLANSFADTNKVKSNEDFESFKIKSIATHDLTENASQQNSNYELFNISEHAAYLGHEGKSEAIANKGVTDTRYSIIPNDIRNLSFATDSVSDYNADLSAISGGNSNSHARFKDSQFLGSTSKLFSSSTLSDVSLSNRGKYQSLFNADKHSFSDSAGLQISIIETVNASFSSSGILQANIVGQVAGQFSRQDEALSQKTLYFRLTLPSPLKFKKMLMNPEIESLQNSGTELSFKANSIKSNTVIALYSLNIEPNIYQKCVPFLLQATPKIDKCKLSIMIEIVKNVEAIVLEIPGKDYRLKNVHLTIGLKGCRPETAVSRPMGEFNKKFGKLTIKAEDLMLDEEHQAKFPVRFTLEHVPDSEVEAEIDLRWKFDSDQHSSARIAWGSDPTGNVSQIESKKCSMQGARFEFICKIPNS